MTPCTETNAWPRRAGRGLAAALLSLLCATPGLAQAQEGTEVHGSLIIDDTMSLSPMPVDEARQRLASVAADALLERRWPEALDELDVLRSGVALSDEPTEQRLDALLDMVRFEVAWWRELGESERALAATSGLRVTEAVPGERLEELRELARLFVAHDLVSELRDELEQANRQEADPGLVSTVREALSDGDRDLMGELGSRAQPVLLDELVRTAGERRNNYQDPLYYLLELDKDVAMDAALELLRAGKISSSRVLGCLSWRKVFARREAWIMRSPRPPRLRGQRAYELLVACLDAPPLEADLGWHWGSVNAVMGNFHTADAYTPALCEALARACAEGPVDRVLNLFDYHRRIDSLRPFLERMLADPRRAVRAEAAEQLANYPDDSALRRHVDDDEPRVRLALARSLQQRTVPTTIYQANWYMGSASNRPNTLERELGPVIGEREHSLLRILVGDTDPEVRREAVVALLDLPEPLEASLYETLADDTHGAVRELLAREVRHEEAVFERILTELADDPDPAVRRAVADRREEGPLSAALGRVLALQVRDPDPAVREHAIQGLVSVPSLGVTPELVQKALGDPDPHVRVQTVTNADARAVDLGAVVCTAIEDSDRDVRLAAERRLYDALSGQQWIAWEDKFIEAVDRMPDTTLVTFQRNLPKALVRTGAGARALVGWALRTEDVGFVEAISRASNDGAYAAWLELDEETFGAWWSALARQQANGFYKWANFLIQQEAGRERAFATLARDDLDAPARMAALAVVAGGLQERELPALLESLRQVIAKTGSSGALEPNVHHWANEFVGRLAGVHRNAVVRQLLPMEARGEPLPTLLALVADEYQAGATGGAELTRDFLAGWYRSEGTAHRFVAQAVEAIAQHPEAAPPGLLEGAVRGPYARSALRAMAGLRDPAHLPVLEQCLAPDWRVAGLSADQLVIDARDAVVAQMSDEAVEVLLSGAAKARSSNQRGIILAGVKSIQTFQEAQRAWQRRLVEGQGKDGAVLELIGMLDHEDPLVRYEAVRGLGTLRAVDQLPRIIRVMANDPDERVRAVAESTLDRLHAQETRAPSDDV